MTDEQILVARYFVATTLSVQQCLEHGLFAEALELLVRIHHAIGWLREMDGRCLECGGEQ